MCFVFGLCTLAGSKTKHTKILPQLDERRCMALRNQIIETRCAKPSTFSIFWKFNNVVTALNFPSKDDFSLALTWLWPGQTVDDPNFQHGRGMTEHKMHGPRGAGNWQGQQVEQFCATIKPWHYSYLRGYIETEGNGLVEPFYPIDNLQAELILCVVYTTWVWRIFTP